MEEVVFSIKDKIDGLEVGDLTFNYTLRENEFEDSPYRSELFVLSNNNTKFIACYLGCIFGKDSWIVRPSNDEEIDYIYDNYEEPTIDSFVNREGESVRPNTFLIQEEDNVFDIVSLKDKPLDPKYLINYR